MPAARNGWRRLGPFVGLVLSAHAAVLSLPVRPAASSPAAQALALQTRTIERTVEPVRQAPPEPAATKPPPVRAERAAAIPAPPAEPESQDPPAPELVAPQAPAAAPDDEVPSLAGGWALPGIATEDDFFLARSLLAVPPVPTAPVLIEYPAFAGPAGHYRGELTLFIDEHGVVVRVRAAGEPLPAELEEAARRAFMAVRFSPGQLAEQGAVKSRIRVEVVFESGAVPRSG